jgi:hypothetical protein
MINAIFRDKYRENSESRFFKLSTAVHSRTGKNDRLLVLASAVLPLHQQKRAGTA